MTIPEADREVNSQPIGQEIRKAIEAIPIKYQKSEDSHPQEFKQGVFDAPESRAEERRSVLN